MTATSLVSFPGGLLAAGQIDDAQPAHPSASPGARASPVRKPSSSGPRCSIAAVIARTRDSASALREAKATPQMPHTLLFDLRRGEEGSARTDGVFPQTKRGLLNGCPHTRQTGPATTKSTTSPQRRAQIEERFTLQEQAPIHRLSIQGKCCPTGRRRCKPSSGSLASRTWANCRNCTRVDSSGWPRRLGNTAGSRRSLRVKLRPGHPS